MSTGTIAERATVIALFNGQLMKCKMIHTSADKILNLIKKTENMNKKPIAIDSITGTHVTVPKLSESLHHAVASFAQIPGGGICVRNDFYDIVRLGCSLYARCCWLSNRGL